LPQAPGSDGRHEGAKAVASQDDPPGGSTQQSGRLGDNDEVLGEGVQVVPVGGSIGEAVTAQVDGNGGSKEPKTPGDGSPVPGRLAESVDQEGPRSSDLQLRVLAGGGEGSPVNRAALASRPPGGTTPVEKVEALRSPFHQVPGRLDLLVGRRDGVQGERERRSQGGPIRPDGPQGWDVGRSLGHRIDRRGRLRRLEVGHGTIGLG
jgi:hypothetical protein